MGVKLSMLSDVRLMCLNKDVFAYISYTLLNLYFWFLISVGFSVFVGFWRVFFFANIGHSCIIL